MQIHDTRQDRINLVHNNKRYGLTKIDEVVLFFINFILLFPRYKTYLYVCAQPEQLLLGRRCNR